MTVSALIAAIGPQFLAVVLPLLMTEVVGRRAQRIPRQWLPWVAVVLGGLSSAIPGMPSVADGLQGGALAVAANEALKVLRPTLRK